MKIFIFIFVILFMLPVVALADSEDHESMVAFGHHMGLYL